MFSIFLCSIFFRKSFYTWYTGILGSSRVSHDWLVLSLVYFSQRSVSTFSAKQQAKSPTKQHISYVQMKLQLLLSQPKCLFHPSSILYQPKSSEDFTGTSTIWEWSLPLIQSWGQVTLTTKQGCNYHIWSPSWCHILLTFPAQALLGLGTRLPGHGPQPLFALWAWRVTWWLPIS